MHCIRITIPHRNLKSSHEKRCQIAAGRKTNRQEAQEKRTMRPRKDRSQSPNTKKQYKNTNAKNPAIRLGFSRMLVGERGFEPPTHWSQTSCATGLRYSPNAAHINHLPAGRQSLSRTFSASQRAFAALLFFLCDLPAPPAILDAHRPSTRPVRSRKELSHETVLHPGRLLALSTYRA